MADTYKVLYQGQLSTSSGVVYTAPSGTGQTIIKSMRIVNTASGSTTVTLWQDTGGTLGTVAAANSNVILPATTVDAGGFAEFEGTLTMATGTKIAAVAGAATSITLTIYGLEIT